MVERQKRVFLGLIAATALVLVGYYYQTAWSIEENIAYPQLRGKSLMMLTAESLLCETLTNICHRYPLCEGIAVLVRNETQPIVTTQGLASTYRGFSTNVTRSFSTRSVYEVGDRRYV